MRVRVRVRVRVGARANLQRLRALDVPQRLDLRLSGLAAAAASHRALNVDAAAAQLQG